MSEVYLTVEQAAEALDLNKYTILKYVRAEIFPNARLRDGSRRKGYRIPARDVLQYAANQGDDVVAQAERVVERARQEMQSNLVRAS